MRKELIFHEVNILFFCQEAGLNFGITVYEDTLDLDSWIQAQIKLSVVRYVRVCSNVLRTLVPSGPRDDVIYISQSSIVTEIFLCTLE